MILDSAKAVTKFTLLFLNNRRKALQRALLAGEKKNKPTKKTKEETPPEPEPELEMPLVETPPPPPTPPREPTPPPPPVEEEEEPEPPPPPPPPRKRRARRPEVDGLRLIVDNSLRLASRRNNE